MSQKEVKYTSNLSQTAFPSLPLPCVSQDRVGDTVPAHLVLVFVWSRTLSGNGDNTPLACGKVFQNQEGQQLEDLHMPYVTIFARAPKWPWAPGTARG